MAAEKTTTGQGSPSSQISRSTEPESTLIRASAKRKKIADPLIQLLAKRQVLMTPSPTPSACGLTSNSGDLQAHIPHQTDPEAAEEVQSPLPLGTAMSRSGRRRSNSQDEEMARSMISDLKDLPSKEDMAISAYVWTKSNSVPQPADPLHLGHKFKESHEADATVEELHRVNQDWIAVCSEANKPGGTPLTEEQYVRYKTAHERAIMMYVHQQRQIQVDLEGSLVTVSPAIKTENLCKLTHNDTKDGWRYPGGLNPMTQHRSVSSTFQQQMNGFKRDYFDNGFTYAGDYPMVTYVGERIGSDGELLLDMGGHRFALAGARAMERDYKYVRRHEVDWAAVAANGGLGDLVLMEDDSESIESDTMAADGKQHSAQLRQPWEARRKAYDELVAEPRH